MVYSPWIIRGLAFRKVCMVIFQANLKNLLMMLLNISPKSEHNQSSRVFQASFLGHSMGWAMALKVHLKQPLAWDGTILVAPTSKICRGSHSTPESVTGLWITTELGRLQVSPSEIVVSQQGF